MPQEAAGSHCRTTVFIDAAAPRDSKVLLWYRETARYSQELKAIVDR
jgi:hypothetical protein